MKKQKLHVHTLAEDINKYLEVYGEDPWDDVRNEFDPPFELDKIKTRVKTGLPVDTTFTPLPMADVQSELNPKRKHPKRGSKQHHAFNAVTRNGVDKIEV